MADLSTFKAPYLSKQRIWRAADDFRERYWSNTIPVDIEKIIEFKLKIEILPKAGLCETANTNAYLSCNCKELRVDNDQCLNRALEPQYRYSLAHEIGHFVLHTDILHIIRPHSIEDWKSNILTIPEGQYSWVEQHAYEFAGRLLVPHEKLIELLISQKEKILEATEELPEMDKSVLAWYVAPLVCRKFHVSPKVIEKRIEREEIDLTDL